MSSVQTTLYNIFQEKEKTVNGTKENAGTMNGTKETAGTLIRTKETKGKDYSLQDMIQVKTKINILLCSSVCL